MAKKDPSADAAEPIANLCKVISFNPTLNIIVCEKDGKQIQTNAIEGYDGSGYVAI
jgi:hypothetical protein